MVAPAKRSGSVKKVKKRTPGGRMKVFFRHEKPGKPSCGRCGGMVSEETSRMYGGVLCSPCVENLLRYVTRMEAKQSNPELFKGVDFTRDLTIEKFLPAGWWQNLSSGKLKDIKVKVAGKKEKLSKTKAEEKRVAHKAEKPAKEKKHATEKKVVKKAESASKSKKKSTK